MKIPVYQVVVVRILLAIYFSVLTCSLFLSRTSLFNHMATDRYREAIAQVIPLKSSLLYVNNTISNKFSPSSVYLMLSNLLGNIILFIPYGILVPMAFPCFYPYRKILVSALLVSLTAELTQYIFQVSVFDVDDIFLNTLGGVVGYRLLRLWEKVQFTSNQESQ